MHLISAERCRTTDQAASLQAHAVTALYDSCQVAEEIERDLDLVGITAIEDKLQTGVPKAISTLIAAGMKARPHRPCVNKGHRLHAERKHEAQPVQYQQQDEPAAGTAALL